MNDKCTWLKSSIVLFALVFIGILRIVSTVPIIGKPLSIVLVLLCIVFSIFSYIGTKHNNEF